MLSKCLTVFHLLWNWQGEPAILQSRATDEHGNVQPTRSALIAERGLNSYTHYNAVQSWQVEGDGKARHVHL